MTRFGYVMTTYFALLGFASAAIFPVSPKFIWNASASVPIGLYAMHPAGALHVTELVVVRPPAALASFLDERRYLPKGVPMLKRILALPGQTVCRTDRTITVDGNRHGRGARPRQKWPSAPDLAGLPRCRRRRGLPDELAVRGLLRRPLFRSASRQHHRRPGRSTLDARGGLTVPDRHPPIAILSRSPRQYPSSFPATPASDRRQATESYRRRHRFSACIGLAILAMIGCRAADAEPATVRPMPLRSTYAPFAAFVAEASQRFGIPAAWIRAVMHAESFGDVRAISPKGAIGLMQIMPETWAGLRQRYRLGADPYDAHDNIIAGAAYLRELHDRYGIPGFLAAYNAGPARWEDHLATGRPLPAETRAYLPVSRRSSAEVQPTTRSSSPPW